MELQLKPEEAAKEGQTRNKEQGQWIENSYKLGRY